MSRLPASSTGALSSPLRDALKRTLLGRMLAAVWRVRRGPRCAVRASLVERSDRRQNRIPPPSPRRRDVRSVVAIPAGPGSLEALCDTIESVQASDGDAAQVVVIDDCSIDSRESMVRGRFEGVDVVRPAVPTGGPPNMWRLCQLAMDHAFARYDFEQWVKMDTDALVTAPRFSAVLLDRIAASSQNGGMAGSYLTRCDGVPEDSAYHAGVLNRDMPRDPVLSVAARRARANGWRDGDVVQTGVCAITRNACESLSRDGWLSWRRPWHSQVSEDLALSVFVVASGHELISLGDPDGVLAVAHNQLALSKEEVADGRWAAAHSVRRGLSGETEYELRSFFRTRRADWEEAADANASDGPRKPRLVA